MWIEEKQTAKGTQYKYIERYRCPQTGKWRKTSVTLPSNSKSATKQATALLSNKIATLSESAIIQCTIEKLIDEYFAFKSHSLKGSTAYSLRCACNKITLNLGKDTLVSKIDLPSLQRIINEMQAKQMSYNHMLKIKRVILGILRFAENMQYIKSARFAEKLVVQKRPLTLEEVKRQQFKYLDRFTLARVLSQAKEIHKRIGLALEFQSLTGLRYGELAALRRQDYDGEKVNVNASIRFSVNVNHPDYRSTPKTVVSYRDIYLCRRAKEIINYFITDNERMNKWWPSYIDRGYIFTTQRGTPINLREVNRVLENIPGEIKYTTHIFRHTHISQLVEQGFDLKAIMDRVGHTTAKMTLEIYSHVSEETRKNIAKKMDQIKEEQA